MADFNIERKNGQATDESILALFHADKDAALRAHDKVFRATRTWYDFYKGIYLHDASSRNSVHIPLLFTLLWSDVAHKVDITFGMPNPIGFISHRPEARALAMKNEMLLAVQLEDAEAYQKAVDLYAQSDIYGTGWCRVGWHHDEETETQRERVLDTVINVARSHTIFDGPNMSVEDILDVWPHAGKIRLRDCGHIYIRYHKDLDDMLDENQAAKERGEPPIWDPAGLKELQRSAPRGAVEDRMIERSHVWRNYQAYQNRSDYEKPIEIIERYGLVPSEAAIKGNRNVLIAVGNDKVLLKYRSNPYGKRMFPVFAYTPTPDPHSIHGTGKIQMGAKLQAVSNHMLNQKLDILDMFRSPMFAQDDQMGLPDIMLAKPGRVFKVNTQGRPIQDAFMPITPNLQGLQFVAPEIEQLSRYIEQAFGIARDTIAGIPGQQETARGFIGRKEGAMKRILLESRLAEKMWFEPTVNAMRRLNRRFLSVPKQIAMIGSGAVLNSITGLPYPQEPQIIDLDDLNGEYYARARGASQMMNKAMRGDTLLKAQAMLQQNPAMFAATNWLAFEREVLEALDLDPGQLITGDIPLINVLAQQLMGGGGSNSGVPTPTQGQSTLETLEPGLFGPQNAAPMTTGSEDINLGGIFQQ